METLMETSRSEAPPERCPKCGCPTFLKYRLIKNSPAAGCVACGHVVYLTQPMITTYYKHGQPLRKHSGFGFGH